MSEAIGKFISCDRCKKTTFVKAINEREMDGGYTRWTEFEKAEGWTHESFVGDLCPECSFEYDMLKTEFEHKKKEFKDMRKKVE